MTSKLSISDAMERGIQYTDGQHSGDYIAVTRRGDKGRACALATAACGLLEKTPQEIIGYPMTELNIREAERQIQDVLKSEWPELFLPLRLGDGQLGGGFSKLGNDIYEANDRDHKTIPEIIADLKKEGK